MERIITEWVGSSGDRKEEVILVKKQCGIQLLNLLRKIVVAGAGF